MLWITYNPQLGLKRKTICVDGMSKLHVKKCSTKVSRNCPFVSKLCTSYFELFFWLNEKSYLHDNLG